LDKAGVPEDQRLSRTKPEIALALLDRVRAEGLPGRRVVADAGYGVSGVFRDGLEQRGLTYIAGVTGEFVVFTEQPRWDRPAGAGRGRPRTRPRLAATSPRPVTLSALALRSPRRRVTWREGTKGTMSGHFAWVRVWPAQGWATGACADAKPVWLLIEKQGEDGPLKFAFSNLPAGTSRIAAVRVWKSRWPVEQGYQQLKEEFGLDHFEGRSWRGFHHHTAMTLLAYGFLLLERHRLTIEREQQKAARSTRAKKGVPSRC
jgi:SRSO17 transposase